MDAREWKRSTIAILLMVTMLTGDFSAILSPRSAKAAYSGKQLRTVEYLLGGGSDNTVRGDNVAAFGGSSWNAVKATAGVKNVILRGTGIVVKHAYLDMQFQISGNANVNNIGMSLDVEGASSQGTSTRVASEYSVSPWNGSGLSGYMRSVHDVTSLFDRQDDTQWNAGLDTVVGVQVDFSAAVNRVLTTVKLVITYESDYSASAHTEVKTVRFPMTSTTTGDTGTKQTACAANATCGLQYYARVPDAAADADILDVHIDLQATVSTNAASTYQPRIRGAAAGPAYAWSETTLDETTVNVSYQPSVGGANFNRNATQTVDIVNGTVALNLLGGEVVVTYQYATDASSQTETVRYYLDQQTATPGTTRNDIASTTVQVSNSGKNVRNVWMKIHTAPFAAVTMTAYGKVGVSGTERSQGYVFSATNPRSGDTPTIIFDLTQDAGNFSGSTTTIAGANQFSAANGTVVATELYVTFTWDGSANTAQTKSVQFSGGQQGATNLASQWYNWPVRIFLPETVTKTYRSAYIEATYNHSETTSIALGTFTLGVNANTIAVPEAGDTEAYVWTAFYKIATTTFSTVSGDIPWQYRTLEINESSTAADEGYYANVVTVTYDADFSQNGTTYNPKRVRTVEYLLGNGSDNNTRASATLYYAGTSWNTVKATAGTKNIVLEGRNIRVTHAYLDLGFIVSNSANITNVALTMDVEKSSSEGTDTRVAGELDISPYNTSGLSGYFRSTHDATALFDRQTDADWAAGLSVVAGVQVTGPSKRLTTLKLVIDYECDFDLLDHYEVKTVRFPLKSTAVGDTGSRQSACGATVTCGFQYYADMPEGSSNNDIMDVFFEVGGEVDSGTASTLTPSISGGSAGIAYNWTENFASDTFVNVAWTPSVGGANFNRNTTQTLNVLMGTVPMNILGGEVVVTYRFPITAQRQTETLRYYIGQHASNPGTGRADFATTTTGMLNSGMTMTNIWMRIHSSPTDPATLTVFGKVGTSTERSQVYTIAATNPRSSDTPHIVFDLTQDKGNYFSTSTDIASAVQFSAGGAPTGAELFLTFTWDGKQQGPQTQTILMHGSQQGAQTTAGDWANYSIYPRLPESVRKTYRSAYLQTIYTHSQATSITVSTMEFGVQASTTIMTEASDGTNESYTTTFLGQIASGTLATSTDLNWTDRGLLINETMASNDEAFFGNIVVITYDAYQSYLQPRYTQNLFRFYVDDQTLLPYDPWPMGSSTSLAENAEINASSTPPMGNEPVRIRMSLTIASTTVASSTQDFKLQYSATTSSCGAVATSSWTDVGDMNSSSHWRATTTPVATGTPLSTNPFTAGDLLLSTSNRAGTFEHASTSVMNPWPYLETENVEYDWLVASNPATVATSTRYCFRMIKSDGSALNKYTYYPAIKTAGYVAKSQNWMWYEDENHETPTTALANENVAPADVGYGNTVKLRVTLNEVNGVAGVDQKFKVQFSESSTFESGVYDVIATSTCTNAAMWCYGDGVDVDDDPITTRLLSDSTRNGTHNEIGTTSSTLDPEANEPTEYEFTIKHYGASQNTTYFFRLYDITNSRPVGLVTGASYPSLSTAGALLTFTVSGVDNGSSTEGIVTTGTSTATAIPFGTLAIGATSTMAQHLVVSTNAPRGYAVYVHDVDGFVNGFGDPIPTVTAANSSPQAWLSTCLPSAFGCYGYHAGDDTLEGSTRFLTNDTWAKMATTSKEIMYGGGPTVTPEESDIVYRVFIRTRQQAGSYTERIVYVVVPIF